MLRRCPLPEPVLFVWVLAALLAGSGCARPAAKTAAQAAPAPAAVPEGTRLLRAAAERVGTDVLKNLQDLTVTHSHRISSQMGASEAEGISRFVLPDRLCNENETRAGLVKQVTDRKEAWIVFMGRVRTIPEAQLADMRKGLRTRYGALVILRDALRGQVEGEHIGPRVFEGYDAEEVLVRYGETEYRLFISSGGPEVLGVRWPGSFMEGPTEITEIFGDYREDGGLRLPHSLEQRAGGKTVSRYAYTSYAPNQGVSEDLFVRPDVGEAAPPRMGVME